jgi:hypothetical protein
MSRYSNSSVIDRIVREEGVDVETARRWFDEMLVSSTWQRSPTS